jgi:hypothetical protein
MFTSSKTQVYFIDSCLLNISTYKTLYNSSTSNPNRPKTCGLIFIHLQYTQIMLTKPKHEENNKNNKSDTKTNVVTPN